LQFPGVPDIEVTDEVTEPFDVSIIMECSDLAAPAYGGWTAAS